MAVVFGPEVSKIAIIILASLIAAILVGWQVWLCSRGHRTIFTCCLKPPQWLVSRLKNRRRRANGGAGLGNGNGNGTDSELPLFNARR
ncbi:hypothetical protein V8F06_008386 [Rhypophila decipiens]